MPFRMAHDQVPVVRPDQLTAAPQDPVQHRECILILRKQVKVLFIDK